MELFRDPIAVTREIKESFSRRIGIVSASEGAGASFVCGQFALGSCSKVNVAEMGKAYFYVALGMEKRLTDKPAEYYEDELCKCGQLSIKNELFGINWLVRKNGNGPLSPEDLQRLVMFPPDGITYFDFSGCPRENIMPVLSYMDDIYVVIDPLPTKLIEASYFIEEIRLRFPQSVYIVNKMNKGVHKNELKHFLGKGELREIPFYPPEKMYRAEYNCLLPNVK